jgi:hypothetical protein
MSRRAKPRAQLIWYRARHGRWALFTLPTHGNTSDMPQRKALLIGINYFGTPSELKGCINDVQNGKTPHGCRILKKYSSRSGSS